MKTEEGSQELSTRLRARRGDRSLRQVAAEFGVDPMTIKAWEEGWKKPRADKAEAIGRYLGIPTIDVLILMGVLPASEKSA